MRGDGDGGGPGAGGARPLRLIVDTANVLGSRPDGWWRDRVGATSRLLLQLAAAVPRTVALPGGGVGWLGEVEVVLEGAARGAEVPAAVVVHRAPGSGDDHVLRVLDLPGHPTRAVVTADRGLRARLPPDVLVLGPREVLGWAGGGRDSISDL